MSENILTCCCIVLFNPDIERLNENIEAIHNQVERVYLINNGSRNIDDVKKIIIKYENVEIIDLKKNRGIATALNKGCQIAKKYGFSWILTLDQDSICDSLLVNKYIQCLHNYEDIGQLTCYIKDRNASNIQDEASLKECVVDWCITSGSFINIEIWEKIGGFDEVLFIDGVDKDYGLALKKNGYKTLKIGYIGLLHEIGKISRCIKIFGKEHPIYNHSSFRKYYICRNNIYLARKYKDISLGKELLKTLCRIFLVLFYEDQKIEKFVKSIQGVIDGFKIEVRKGC